MTRVLNLRGIDLPRNLAPGIPNNNDRGFWESVPIAEAHDRFLESVGSGWDDVSPIPRAVFSSARAHEFSDELRGILRDEYGDSTLFVVKDPRLCRLVPVWVNALEAYGARPSFVITTRNPLEVAGSLRARDGFSATKSCLLWLRHLLDAEYDSRRFPRVFVSYERLLRDWVCTTDRIARELHLFWPRSDHEANFQIEDFLSSALRHHSFEYSELRARGDIIEWVKQAFEAVSRAEAREEGVDSDLFDELRAQLDRADQAYGPLLAEAKTKIGERDRALAGAKDRSDALEVESQRVAEMLAKREADVAEALQRLETAEAEAVDRREVACAAVEERDQWVNEGARLASVIGEREASLAQRTRKYEELHGEARHLAASVAELETELADARRRLDVTGDEMALLRESLVEREEALSAARVGADEAESQLSSVRAELDEALAERESRLAEARRLSDLLDSRSDELADLRREYDAREVELADAGLRLDAAATQIERAAVERRAWLVERERLETSRGEQEEKLEGALDQGRKLAAAFAETGEVLSRRSVELHDRSEQLLLTQAELAARDALLSQRAQQLGALTSEARLRDEKLVAQSELLVRLDAIGRARGRRWRSLTQFCSWLFPPTAARRGYIKAYLRLRGSDAFDADYYLSRYPDVSHAGLNPRMHFAEHGVREGRQPTGSPYDLPSAILAAPELFDFAAPEPQSAPRDAKSDEGDLAARLGEALAERVPKAACVAVVTGGDEERISLPGCETCEFPPRFGGTYGHDARGDTALVASLEAMRAVGVEFLLVPSSQGELLERNPGFRAYLLGRYSSVFESGEMGSCFELHSPSADRAWRREVADLADWIERETSHEASILDWDTGLGLEEALSGCNVFAFTAPDLLHLDASVDIVAVVSSSDDRLREAKRVARHGVLAVPPDGAAPRLTTSASFAEHAPHVSIIIPCHEQFARTRACINALEETLPTWFHGEVVIIDDASSAETVAELDQLARRHPYVRLLHNDVNAGFLASVNRAVEKATGEFVVLLNNDTIPLPGWLPPLLAPFRTRDDVGAVGGRLIYPDGRLQEAGGLVFSDGTAAKFGYGDPEPDFPLFTVPREVDYCSGCLLAFRRDFFIESGGFDPMYGFGFYEDTDFCFRVRALGRVVLYEPESTIVHVEGASAGTDLRQGAKRFQARNVSLFAERWREALDHQHERPAELDRMALQQLAARAGTR